MKFQKKTNRSRQVRPFSLLQKNKNYEPGSYAILIFSFILILLIVLLFTQFSSLFRVVRSSDFVVGKVAENNFVIERDIAYIDEEATRLKQEAAENLILPVFRLNEDINKQSLDKFDQFQESLTELLQEETPVDTIFLRIQLSFPGVIKKETLTQLANYPMFPQLLSKSREILAEVLKIGLISLPEQNHELFSAGAIEVWRPQEGKLAKEEYPLDSVLTRRNLPGWLDESYGDLSGESTRLIDLLVASFAAENGFLDLDQTYINRQRAANLVEPSINSLVKGQIIVRKGDIVTEKAAGQIKAVGDYSASVNLKSLTGAALFLLIIFAFSLHLLHKRILKIVLKRNQIIFLASMGLSYLLIAALFVKFFQVPAELPFSVILPTAAISILVSLIISGNVGIIFSITISLFLLPVLEMDIYSFLFAALTGIAGSAVVSNAEKRIDLVWAGFFLSLINCFILLALGLLGKYQSGWMLYALVWGILNGFLGSMISLSFLPILEHLLNAPTRFRLIELADLNAPILKRMLSLAPGTYSHSISVANLAESACNEINANALLARVGAYYHDIGKIDQAEYFIENQRTFNKHDDLKPSLSVAVIKAHVKMGIEKAKELALPYEVIDIIAQHHGRGIIKYFYQRALEKDRKKKIASEDYSYPGARPRTKEAAIVLLADTVEAVSRTLKKPTIAKLDKFVWNIVMDKFTSNELSECDLTLKDLEVIKNSFVQILAGYYHSRIEYPKIKEEAG